MHYYNGKDNYEVVKKYANDIRSLIDKESSSYINNKKCYGEISIILANSYLMDEEIDKYI